MSELTKTSIFYKESFTHADFDTVKLEQNLEDGGKKTYKVPVFVGKYSVEGLLYVEDKFRKACKRLEYTEGDELFDNWEFCLADTAEDKWTNLVAGIADADRTPNRFNEEMTNFYYCNACN